MGEPLIGTWEINNRINLFILDAITPEFLADISASKGRSIAKQFAHIHNVRLMWLKEGAPEFFATQTKIDTEKTIDKDLINSSLISSGEAISGLLLKAIEMNGKIKGFKPHATAFVAYLASHEAHHRSQIILTLKQSGHHLDKKTLFGIWEWGVR
jgi:uncharacterized damage-inducible protein DinB